MALRRDLFRELGGFDEAFVMDLDDIDLSLRIRARGLRVRYRGDICIVHHEGATRSTSNRANHEHFHRRWEELLVPDDDLLHELFAARIDPRANDESLNPGRRAEISVEGMVTGIAPEADEARALLAGLDALGIEAAARDHSLPLQIADLDAETDALLHAARARPRRDGALVLEVSRPEAFHHTGTPTVLRLAAVPERRRRLASPFAVWAPDETAARALAAAGFPDDRISVLEPFLPRVTPGPGGRGILAILPSHLPQLAEATARALAPLAGEHELRLALTVATPELREAAAGWAPRAEVLPRPLREHDLAREAREADAVVVLDPDDGFQRGILAAAGAGAAVVARPGGAAQGVLGAGLATCADAASVAAVRAAVEDALTGAADRASRSATVAAACSGPAWQKRLADLLDVARARASVRRPRPARAPEGDRPPSWSSPANHRTGAPHRRAAHGRPAPLAGPPGPRPDPALQ